MVIKNAKLNLKRPQENAVILASKIQNFATINGDNTNFQEFKQIKIRKGLEQIMTKIQLNMRNKFETMNDDESLLLANEGSQLASNGLKEKKMSNLEILKKKELMKNYKKRTDTQVTPGTTMMFTNLNTLQNQLSETIEAGLNEESEISRTIELKDLSKQIEYMRTLADKETYFKLQNLQKKAF